MSEAMWTDDQAIDAWLTWLETSRGRSQRTLQAYRSNITKLRQFLAQDGVALLDADQVQLEVFTGLWLHKKGVIARSRIPYISAVRGFYKWAAERKVIKRNVGGQLTHPITGRPLPNVISLQDAERLMWCPDMSTFIGIRDAAMLSMLIGCGLRVSGLVGLNEGDLQPMKIDDEPRLTVRLREKGNKERIMPVPRDAEMLLRVYLAHDDLAGVDRNVEVRKGASMVTDRVLFVSVRSTRLAADLHIGEERRLTRKAVHDMIGRYGRRLVPPIPAEHLHPHAFRHLFGTELTEDDVSLAATQDLMGHADPSSTAVYIQMAQRRKAKLIDQHAPLAKMRTPVSELLKRLPG